MGPGNEGSPNGFVEKNAGVAVAVVQNPLTTLADAVAETRRVLALQPGPAVLAGHSWSGTIVSEVGGDPSVSASTRSWSGAWPTEWARTQSNSTPHTYRCSAIPDAKRILKPLAYTGEPALVARPLLATYRCSRARARWQT